MRHVEDRHRAVDVLVNHAGIDYGNEALEGVMKPLTQAGKAFGFHVHAFAFVITMLLLVAINVWKGPPYWVLWVLLGWGLGLLSHWWFVLGPGARPSAASQ